MKKSFLLSLSLIAGLLSVNAQSKINTFPDYGDVGIGTLTPATWFPGRVFEMVDHRPIIKLSPLTEGGLATIQLKGAYNNTNGTPDEFHINYVSSMTIPRIIIGAYYNGGGEIFSIMGNGNIGIGVPIPTDKLAVNGLIRAREVKVESKDWPDYVFKPDFQLPALKDIESYIAKNGRLPEVPSAAVIASEGLQLGEMNKVLLKKVEELTLYLIEKDKNETRQQQEINTLKEQMALLLKGKK